MTEGKGRYLAFPFRIGDDGRVATVASLEDHVREELIQLILTNIGERAFLPEFGGGARSLVFENIGSTTEPMMKSILTRSITRWLGHRLTLEGLTVEVNNEKIEIEITYRVPGAEESKILQFVHNGEGR